jgi:hypothetical protein
MSNPADPEKPPKKSSVTQIVFRDAISNTFFFVGGTTVIILVGLWSWTFGVILALIETFFAVIQSLRVLFIISADVLLYFFGKPEDNNSDIRTATIIRFFELCIWMACLCVLYRFFF